MGLIYQNEILYSGSGGGGGTGDVADVYVNGQSVLDANKIAQITNYVELTQAEYDALPASKESDNVLYCIKDQATADTTVAPIVYSTNEREIGVWTDGKPLYQKTFYYATLSSSSYDWTLLESFAGIDTFVTYNVMCGYTEGTSKQLGGDYYRLCYMNDGIYYYTPNLGNYIIDVYVTIQYTKTTDQPGSGKYAPSGVPAVHYSENEQVIGTWIDGNVVYEKTLYYAGGQSGAITFAHGISNFGKLISIEGNCYDNQESKYMPFPRVGPDGNNIGIVAVDSTNVQYAVAGAFATRVVDVYLTIRYTKTTS